MSKRVKILGVKAIPVWLLVLALVVSGAGAAVGTVLAGSVTGNVPVAVSQALLVGEPAAISGSIAEDGWVDNMPQPVDWVDGQADSPPEVASASAPDRSIGAVSDDQTAFQFAAEIDTGDIYFFYVPLKNASSSDMVAQLTLNFPECVEVEVMDGNHDTPDDDNVENLVRTGLYTWKFDLDDDAEKDTPADNAAGDVIVIVVQVDDPCPPGYYTISGTIEQIAY